MTMAQAMNVLLLIQKRGSNFFDACLPFSTISLVVGAFGAFPPCLFSVPKSCVGPRGLHLALFIDLLYQPPVP